MSHLITPEVHRTPLCTTLAPSGPAPAASCSAERLAEDEQIGTRLFVLPSLLLVFAPATQRLACYPSPSRDVIGNRPKAMWGFPGGNTSATAAPGGTARNRPDNYFERHGWPDPGWPYSDEPALLTGLFAVAVAQTVVIAYHYVHLRTRSPRIQGGALPSTLSHFWADAAGHLAQVRL